MKMKNMRKWILPLGVATSTFIPLAVAVSCGNTDKMVNIPASSRSDDEIAKDLSKWSQGASMVGMMSPINNITTEQVKTYWNQPEGESIRVAAITTVLGKLWGKGSDDVILAIVKGVEKAKDSSADYQGYVNEYKVYLLNNIRDFLSKNKVSDSLQKFDGFMNWFVDSANTYANLKQVLMGGAINENFISGVQSSLNNGVADDKKVFVIPEANGGSVNTPASTPASNPPVAQVSSATPAQSDVVTPITPSPFVVKQMTQAEIDSWATAKYQLIKPAIDGFEIYNHDWLAEDIPNVDKFKQYVLSTDADEQLPDNIDTYNRTAADAGKLLRTFLVESTIGSIWGVNSKDSVDNIVGIAMQALPNAIAMQSAIEDEEKKHLGSLPEYASFLEWMVDPQGHYSNFRSLCQSPSDALMNKFQDAFKKLNTDQAKKDFDIFA